jgi:hypothetical protein
VIRKTKSALFRGVVDQRGTSDDHFAVVKVAKLQIRLRFLGVCGGCAQPRVARSQDTTQRRYCWLSKLPVHWLDHPERHSLHSTRSKVTAHEQSEASPTRQPPQRSAHTQCWDSANPSSNTSTAREQRKSVALPSSIPICADIWARNCATTMSESLRTVMPSHLRLLRLLTVASLGQQLDQSQSALSLAQLGCCG